MASWEHSFFGGGQGSEFSDKEIFFPTKFSWDIMDCNG